MTGNSLPRHVVDHYEDPYHYGECERPTHLGETYSAACDASANSTDGPKRDSLIVQLRTVNGKIVEAWFQGDGCIVSQAAASRLMEQIEGQSLETAERISVQDVLGWLQIDAADISPNCCQLALDAMQSAIAGLLDEDEDGPTFLGLNLGDEC